MTPGHGAFLKSMSRTNILCTVSHSHRSIIDSILPQIALRRDCNGK